jgi:hypothetical protein
MKSIALVGDTRVLACASTSRSLAPGAEQQLCRPAQAHGGA